MIKKMRLSLESLEVESMQMPAAAPMRAVTTSRTCPTRCDTEFDCTDGFCSELCATVAC